MWDIYICLVKKYGRIYFICLGVYAQVYFTAKYFDISQRLEMDFIKFIFLTIGVVFLLPVFAEEMKYK